MESVSSYKENLEEVIKNYVKDNHLYLDCITTKYKSGTQDINDKSAICGFAYNIIENIGCDRHASLIKIEFVSNTKDTLTICVNEDYESIINVIKTYNKANNIKVKYVRNNIKPMSVKEKRRRGNW